MTDKELLQRIVVDPAVMVGKPVVRGTRLTVDHILGQLAHGATEQDVIDEYDGLSMDDIRACFLFATRALEETDFMPLAMESNP